MTASVARALMSLASACLGPERREWASAMQAEFEAAIEDGRPLAFAAGCLVAAWREMASVGERRLVLASYALALGLLIPMAVHQFGQAASFVMVPVDGLLATGIAPNPYLVWSQNSAILMLLLLWLLLGFAHLALAWVLVEGDWPRVVKLGALIGATMVTLVLFAGVLMFDFAPLVAQARDLALELTAIVAAARWRASLALRATGVPLAW